jgi:hypothetical protein
MYRAVLEAYRAEQNMDESLAVGVYRRMAAARNNILISQDPETGVQVYESVPNDKVQKAGADGLCKMKGLNAAEKVAMDVTATVELPATLREKLDNAYKPTGSE